MKSTTSAPGIPTSNESRPWPRHILHIVSVCLTPLLWLALLVGAILLLASLLRYLTAPAGFVIEQQINVVAVGIGLVLSTIVYTVGIVRALRKIGAWEREGKTALATGGLWGLAIRAITMALPLLLILLLH